MKISEMTNEELADYIVNVIGGGIFKEYYAEAAARLRKFDITLIAQKAKAAAEGYAHGCEEVADLRRRLKVVEELQEENKRLRAALKPVLECKVLSAMTAEVKPGRSEYCATIIEKVQHIYNDGESKQKEGDAK